MRGGPLVLNEIRNGVQVNTYPQLDAKGVAFYDGIKSNPGDLESKMFYKALADGSEQLVLPEQAFVVSQILDGIYTSAKTGKPVYFE